jgi:hypothetical protein
MTDEINIVNMWSEILWRVLGLPRVNGLKFFELEELQVKNSDQLHFVAITYSQKDFFRAGLLQLVKDSLKNPRYKVRVVSMGKECNYYQLVLRTVKIIKGTSTYAFMKMFIAISHQNLL